jgi:hypothetical protein
MRQLPLFISAVLALVAPSTSVGSDNAKPVRSTTPLRADETAVYKSVLWTYSGGKDAS